MSVRFVMKTWKSKPKLKPDPNLKLMDQVRQVLRYHHYAYNTEKNLGHESVKTTEIYTHVLEKDLSATMSPLDAL